VSHDLRNPLHAIIGFSGLLQRKYGTQMPTEAATWLAQIEHAGRRMNGLIDDLLRLAHLGRQALQLAAVDLDALVRGVVAERRLAMLDAHVTLQIDPLPQVVADAALLRQVFVNLLSNACKFTRKTPQARVEVGCMTTDGELVLFVRDNGPGFDMAQAHKLFGAFERLHSAEEFEGTGVGLSTVQRIVQRHGGRVWAHAEPGRGATFCFTLRATVS
jgi:signal transduction histidine kinase